jgi:hypothetical protein
MSMTENKWRRILEFYNQFVKMLAAHWQSRTLEKPQCCVYSPSRFDLSFQLPPEIWLPAKIAVPDVSIRSHHAIGATLRRFLCCSARNQTFRETKRGPLKMEMRNRSALEGSGYPRCRTFPPDE